MTELSEKEKKVLAEINKRLTNMIMIVVLFLGASWLLINQPGFLFPAPEEDALAVVEEDFDKVENGIHLATGLIAEEGYELIRANCGACHSLKLVTQNRNTRDGWLETIRWMQETQKLWDLGENEPGILDYLAKHYGPEETGRRKPLEIAEWYELE